MLTPAFELKQDDNFLTIIIRAPYAKVGPCCVNPIGQKNQVMRKPKFVLCKDPD